MVPTKKARLGSNVWLVALFALAAVLARGASQAQTFYLVTLLGANPNPIVAGKTITLTGMAFPSKPVVMLTPTDNLFVGPQKAKVTSASNTQVIAQLPEAMCEGKYDIVIKDANSAYQTNTLSIVVQPAKPVLYQVAFQKFNCVKESHDFSASDEVYFMGLTYDTAKATLTRSESRVFENVNQGMEINPAYWEFEAPYIPLLETPVADPSQCIVECALGECDNYNIQFPYLETQWNMSFGVDQFMYGVWKSDNAVEYVKGEYWPTLLSPNYTRGYKSAIMQICMQNAITDTTDDDVLGLFELTWKPADIEIARKYFGQPYLKVVDVYGDSSHYKMAFLLIRVQ